MNTRTILGAACMILVLNGCKQEKGESCQVDDDCEGEQLICCKTNPYAIETDRGICMTREECDTRDASTDPGVDGEEDTVEDPADDGDAPEEVTDDPAPDPTVEPVDDPVDDPEPEDVTVDEDDPADATTD